jgi:uncharacterized damage-inducible protein DinB
MIQSFTKWFAWNHAANEKHIESFLAANSLPVQATRIMSHLLNAHQVWLHRISPEDIAYVPPWQPLEPEKFTEVNNQNNRLTRALLAEASGIQPDQPVYYQNTKGDQFENTVAEIFFHLLAHSAYHRGQLALLLRQSGYEPPVTDYIFYIREPF